MHVLPHGEKGGMENGVINIVNNLDREVFCSSICIISKSENQIERLVNPDIPIFEIPKKEGGFDYYLFAKLSKLFKFKLELQF